MITKVEQEYLIKMGQLGLKYGVFFPQLGKIMEQNILTLEGLKKFEIELMMMRAETGALKPPKNFKRSHRYFTKVLSDSAKIVDQVRQYLNTREQRDINKLQPLMVRLQKTATRFNKEFLRAAESRGFDVEAYRI